MIRNRLLIDGVWRDAARWETYRNPSDLSDVIGEYARATVDDAAEAIAAARRALPRWSASNPQLRSDVLRRAAALFYERADVLATTMAREEGKIVKDARGEAIRAAQIFQYYSGEPVRHRGAFLPSLRDSINVIVDYEPIGVVSLITPWNFPLATPAWKIAAALAYGNTIVFKPSEITPGCSVAIAEILLLAGVPAGVFNMVLGSGAELSDTLIAGSNGVSFTGATPVGRSVLERAARTMTKVQLELGGKSPLVVLDDAKLDHAVQVAFDGAYPQTGQRCTASGRIIVTRGIHDEFVERLAMKASAARVGNAMHSTTEIGPVATRQQLEKNLRYVDIGKQDGAKLLCGGGRVDIETDGFYFAPTLFAETKSAMRINQEEIFGPIAAVIEVDDLDEAIAIAADSELALSSAICTRSLYAAEKFRKASTSGMVVINAPTSGAEYHVPFGGRKMSGFGAPEQGSATAEFFTEVKTTYINYVTD